ncbi:hypothetical protein [Saccharothrix sp. HUAS TT1]|uniref:hypothetical protein n=1 Tax=unclassified Saccharothrix TaxID=2593673 RepID=UPI00345B8535
MPTAIARATGICLVVHSYLGGLWLDRHGERFVVFDEAREWLNRPLGIGEDFGVLGMMLLLLASGHAAVSARRGVGSRTPSPAMAGGPGPVGSGRAVEPSSGQGVESGSGRAVEPGSGQAAGLGSEQEGEPGSGQAAEFGSGRAAESGSEEAGESGSEREAGVRSVGWRDDVRRLVRIAVPVAVAALLTAVLLLLDVEVLVQPMALVLGIELVIWLTGALAVRTNAWLVPLGQLLVVAGLLLAGGVSADFAMPLVLFPLAVLGQVIGRLPGWAVALFGFGVWGLLAWTEHVHPGVAEWWYPLTALYAVLFYVITTRARTTTRAVRWLAGRARWLLVLTGTLGWAVLGLGLPFPVGFLLGLGALALVAELTRRFDRAGEVSP